MVTKENMQSTPFRISEAVAIGIHAVTLMAKTPETVWTAQRIAEQLHISFEHCVRVLHRLRKGAILRSIRGANGGFLLGLDPEALSVLRIYEILEGKLADRQCLFHTAKCAGKCPLFQELLDGVNEQIRDYFTRTTIADLAGK